MCQYVCHTVCVYACNIVESCKICSTTDSEMQQAQYSEGPNEQPTTPNQTTYDRSMCNQ